MTTPAEERLWQQLFNRLDSIDRKLDTKVNYKAFDEYKQETNGRIDKLDKELELLHAAAISPDQVVQLIGQKMQESEARGISRNERVVRLGVAAASLGTFTILVAKELLS
jgi:tetrahydromethanopterin S-methyltransferase subunit G